MALFITMGDIAVENCRELCGISLLGTLWQSSALYILTEDVALEYGAVDIYWGRCDTEWHCRYLVGALR